ncbi:SEC-C metal-binding domain-containing protein [Pseudosulfitobacter pseudonitzschiae]|uniref:SEC-C metal-binding domain-containing protein n=1 Tax=Pseudosulfitobacter pseudonitzschiae TaxID=1402135 RepID=UPI001AF6DA8B|nr:SEC-C domain-containing protein [Pseudosulfitobacter pseudonitzschiae]MBM1833061.1 SEC-C domain-containing protein [Pseudosulfitobacter pseudonitzschiae]MBM1837929.1 SEC-C domain-containing protein [Pseudosulfitobacter pseudonitzschiae]MBM1843190.1 SEC-C domain-containing protein [Pseudosulfitobacter pseudonitzschiae]MBM1848056.1 SEC-C domain-containing protein [Pseudosulfitobacter pseudonitzschiae]
MLIAQLRHYGPPPQRVSQQGSFGNTAEQFGRDTRSSANPMHRGQGKIGRNERCPCGSGKKFKKCHGR